MQQYRSTRTHIIYRYKGREAAGVGGHALQGIAARGHPPNSQEVKKGSCSKGVPVCLFCPSCSCACHGSGDDGHGQDTPTTPSRPGCPWWQLRSTTAPPHRTGYTPILPTAHGGIWWQLMTPTLPTAPEPHKTHPEPPRL